MKKRLKNPFAQFRKYLYSHESWYCLVRENDVENSDLNVACDVNFRLVDEKSVSDTTRFEDENYVHIYQKMLDAGERGLYGYLDGKCVYRIWAKTQGYEKCLRRTILRIKGNEAYIHYVLTDKNVRGRGIHTLGVKAMCDSFSDRRCVALVTPENLASIRGFEKNGFKKEKKIDVICIFGISFIKEQVMGRNDKKYEEKIARICTNINKKGLQRYDPRDIDIMEERCPKLLSKKYRRRILQCIEILFPQLMRKVFKVVPSDFPTTFTFLAEAYFNARQYQETLPLKYSDIDLMERCLQLYEGNVAKWSYKENRYFFVESDREKLEATMPLYCLARCNNLLTRMGRFYKREEWLDISLQSLYNMLLKHNIFEYDNGAKSISYYYNSSDCTLNVNTEVVDWISQLPEQYIDKSIYDVLEGIIKLILTEQNGDGSWFYYSKEHMKKYGIKETIDCHHSATVLYNLIHVLESGRIMKEEQNLIHAISSGMKYFIDVFFDIKTGRGLTIVGRRRKASSMQYSEALVAMCEFIKCTKIKQSAIKERCEQLIPLVAKQLLKLIKRDGSAPGDCVILPVNMDSINWGNGAILWALVHYKYAFLETHYEEK